ncbi:hypothetical protein ACHHYP_20441 [Achlya hypogyna]|uniref:Transmembrane protein n=1 Tax=Achlya hypogyna TaxID=1202772 RepID=A0A1V9ZIU6_ACHHY|nr:hypothetical protein ACHHYP_20441 [Achlya hypogyna]
MWDFDANLYALTATYVVGIACFFASFLGAYRATRRKHAAQSMPEVPEVTLVKYITKLLRVVCLGIAACQLVLFSHATSIPTATPNVPIFDSVVRALASLVLTLLGFGTNTHPSIRHLFGLGMLGLVGFDTVSEVHYVSATTCGSKGSLCSTLPGITTGQLQQLMVRDLISIVLELWAFLLVCYLCLSIGCCFSRYTQRQLSITNPYSNVRDLLTKYHPELTLKHNV